MSEVTIKNALKTVACAALVVAVTITLLVGFSILFHPKNNQAAFGMPNEAANGIMGEREDSIDVIIIGDSEAFSSFSPLQMWGDYGFTSYVCSTSGQSLPYGTSFLHNATKKQKPRVVVIETNTIYTPFPSGYAVLRAVQDLFPVFEHHDRWKTLTAGDLTTTIQTTYTDDMKGFYLNTGVKKADATDHMKASKRKQEIPLANRIYLKYMVAYCRSIGAEPLLVSTPSTINWNSARHNGIEAIANDLGVRYIDMNVDPTKVTIDWETETRDSGDHLNLAGATKVSKYLGRYLSENFDLPDHRADDSYKSWNECLARYKEQAS